MLKENERTQKKKQEGKNEWTLSCGNNVYNALEKNVKVSENRKKKENKLRKWNLFQRDARFE